MRSTNCGNFVDPNRWLVLILFCVYSCSNAIQWITFAPIATNVKDFFDLSTNQLNMLSSVYMIVFAAGAYFTCTTFEKWGVRRGLLIGCGLNALGGILKVTPGLQKPSYTTMIIPQTLCSLAQLFVLSTPPLIAAQYFVPEKRAFATAVAATANSLGNAVALFVPPLIVVNGTSKEFYILFGWEMVLCVGVFICVIFFLRPPQFKAPSAELLKQVKDESNTGVSRTTDHLEPAGVDTETQGSPTSRGEFLSVKTGLHVPTMDQTGLGDGGDAGSEAKQKSGGCWRRLRDSEELITYVEVGRTVWKLVRQRDFMFLLCAFSISVGSNWTFASVLAQILEPFGVSATLAGVDGALNIALGTVVAYVVGIWVDNHRRYKYPVLICLIGSVLCCLALMLVMLKVTPNSTDMNGLASFVYILAGIFQNTATPICFEFAMEITYPLPESVPGAMLMAGANTVSLILLSISSDMLGNGVASKSACVNVLILVTSVCAVGATLAIFPRERLNRRQAELQARESAAAGLLQEDGETPQEEVLSDERDGAHSVTHPSHDGEPRFLH